MTFLNKSLNKNFTFNDLQIVLGDCIYSTRNDNSTYVIYRKPIDILDGTFYIEFKFYNIILSEFNLQSSEYEFDEAHNYHCKWLEKNFQNEEISSNNGITYKTNDKVKIFRARIDNTSGKVECFEVKGSKK